MDENPISPFVETNARSRRSPANAANGQVNTVESFNASKLMGWDRRAADNGAEHLRRNKRREKGLNAEERFLAFSNAFASHDLEIETAHFKGKKCEAHSPPKATLTTFTQTRRRSTSEVGRQQSCCASNTTPTLAFRQPTSDIASGQSDENVCDGKGTTLSNNRDGERMSEALSFPVMSRINHGEKSQLSSSGSTSNGIEPKSDRLQSKRHRASTHGEHLLDGKRNFDKQDFTAEKLQLPSSVHVELKRSRSLSESDVLEDVILSVEQRERLDRLKRQIYETNSKRKNSRKVNGSKFEVSFSEQSAESTASRESLFPALTEESLKRHSKRHDMMKWDIDSDQMISVAARSNTLNNFDTSSAAENPNASMISAGHIVETNLDERGTSKNTELSRELPLIPSSLSHFTNNHQVKRESERLHFPTPVSNEAGDSSESITVIIERLQARSEPGDIDSRKVSSVQCQQFQSRARSETVALKAKVQSFIEKPLPALPSSTLRVGRTGGAAVKLGHFKMGASTNTAPEKPRERKEGEINVHTCPNVNLFADQSWIYQDKSRKKHRYIRGPATPVPPVDFVFRKDKPDSS